MPQNNLPKKLAHKVAFKTDDFCVEDDKCYFIKNISAEFSEANNDLLVNRVKLFLKNTPFLFKAIYYLFGASFVGRDARYAIRHISSDKAILNLGSGVKKIREDVINVDFFPFANVDVVADITDLPLADQSIDAIICEFVLEHLPNPERVVDEIKRVLKSGGVVYVAVPFVASFHSSPNDFYRWSKQGLRHLMKDFKELDSGIRCGPTAALLYVFSEWLSTIFSFGLSKIQQILFMIFMICFSPLKLLDFIISRLPSSENIAYGFYFIGKKNAR